MAGSGNDDSILGATGGLIYGLIWRESPISRVELSTQTGLTKSTVSTHVDQLLSRGLIRETDLRPSGLEGGRPARLLAIDPAARVVAGVHIGVRQTRIVIADALGRELDAHISSTVRRQPAVALAAVADHVGMLLDRNGVDHAKLAAVGVAVPGIVDPASGICRIAPNLGWREVAVADILSGVLEVPVYLNNTAQAMAVAEAQEARRRGESSDIALLYVGTGVGSAIVSGGRLVRGASGSAGEIGHVSVGSGIACRCGNTGCLETVVSGPAIVRRAREAGVLVTGSRQALSAETIGRAAASGNPVARELLTSIGQELGHAAAWLVQVADPGTLIVAGGVSALGDLLLEPLRQGLQASAMPAVLESLVVRRSYLDSEGKLRGAVLIALRQLDDPSALLLGLGSGVV